MRQENSIKLALNLFGYIYLARGAGVNRKLRQRFLEFVDSINILRPPPRWQRPPPWPQGGSGHGDEKSRCGPVHALVKLTCECCGLRASPRAGIWEPELQLKFARHSWFVAGLLNKACSHAQQAMRDHHLLGPDPQWASYAAVKAASCPSLPYSWGEVTSSSQASGKPVR